MPNERFESVWDALADTPEESADIKVRSELLLQITKQIQARGWSLEDAAKHFNAR